MSFAAITVVLSIRDWLEFCIGWREFNAGSWPLCDKPKIKLRWHDMRHFAVSLWIEQVFSIKEVMTFAGHSSVQMTMERYSHLFPTPDHQHVMA